MYYVLFHEIKKMHINEVATREAVI
uniref:Uncharacterized protein n=1 Tax=Anguilla anguilla TaxID=7936 RepID=A0A0E9U417_ANGAN